MHIPGDMVARLLSLAVLLNFAIAKSAGLNAFQLLALLKVGGSSAVSIKELKQTLSIPGSSLTFTLDSLEKKRLITRQRSKEDRRQWLLSLTARGKKMYSQVIDTQSGMFSPALDKLSDQEKQVFLNTAEAVLRNDKA